MQCTSYFEYSLLLHVDWPGFVLLELSSFIFELELHKTRKFLIDNAFAPDIKKTQTMAVKFVSKHSFRKDSAKVLFQPWVRS